MATEKLQYRVIDPDSKEIKGSEFYISNTGELRYAVSSTPSDKEYDVEIADLELKGESRDNAATHKLLQGILDLSSQCEQDAQFCGFKVEHIHNKDGKFLFAQLTACDMVGDIAAPRA